ncbi:MAG: 4-(cytidine 5'-diphospho)-2-C-methyl-D-erythritol kinase [Lachnospiraceae bacterium]|nr:4-(cytidine 5'-diphospho)-2-C-methyl-D-erythritol kinase [Lachnospiraceae bacterium]
MVTIDAHAKINIGLDVIGCRADGYHEVRMVMQTLGLHDTLTMDVLSDGSAAKSYENLSGREDDSKAADASAVPEDKIHLSIASDDPAIDVSLLPTDGRNLCVKAAKALMEDAGINKEIKIHLVKRIPFEAGLAGGSTDAAAVLKGLNKLLDLHYTNEGLAGIGVKLGADIPYCIYGGTMLAEGIGEKLTPVEPELATMPVLLVKPDFGVSTGGIYQRLDAVKNPPHPNIDRLLQAIRAREPQQIATYMGNILEEVTIAENPKLKKIKTQLRKCGALGALMTGSGPTIFGLFENGEAAERAKTIIEEKHNGYFIKITKTQITNDDIIIVGYSGDKERKT